MSKNIENEFTAQETIIQVGAPDSNGYDNNFWGELSPGMLNKITISPKTEYLLFNDLSSYLLWNIDTAQGVRRFYNIKSNEFVFFSSNCKEIFSILPGQYVKKSSIDSEQWFDVVNYSTSDLDSKKVDYGKLFALSKNEKHLVWIAKGYGICDWDVENGPNIRNFGTGTRDRYISLVISDDGKKVLSVSDLGPLDLWDLESGQKIWRFEGHEAGGFLSALFVDDEKSILSIGSNIIRLWDIETGKLVRTAKLSRNYLEALAVSPCQRYIAFKDSDYGINIVDLNTGKGVQYYSWPILDSGDAQLSFSKDGRKIIGLDRNRIFIRDWITGNLIYTQEFSFPIYVPNNSVCFSPNNNFILGCYKNNVYLWDATTGEEIREMVGHNSRVKYVSFSPDGHLAISAGEDEFVVLWDISSGKEIRRYHTHAGNINNISFSVDGRKIYCGHEDKKVMIWELSNSQNFQRIDLFQDDLLGGTTCHIIDFSYNDQTIIFSEYISSNYGESLKIFDLKKNMEIQTLQIFPKKIGNYLVTFKIFSDDNKIITVTSESDSETGEFAELNIWDISRNQRLLKFGKQMIVSSGRSKMIINVAISKDQQRILTSHGDGSIRLYNRIDGVELRVFKGHRAPVKCVSFSPDGKRAVSDSWDGTIRIWNLLT